jgi:ABC-type sugar transport system ATPase subunit
MARLFRGFEIGADVVRTRVQDVNEVMTINDYSSRKMGFDSGSKQERVAIFGTATNWSEFRG